MLSLQASTCGWAVRGLATLGTLVCVDACCQAVEDGFLDALTEDRTGPEALKLFDDFVDHIRREAATVRTLGQHATTLCEVLSEHANAAAAGDLTANEIKKSLDRLRRRIGTFRSLYICLDEDNE